MKLKNKVNLIIGSSRGLGESLAYKLAKEGVVKLFLVHTPDFDPDCGVKLEKK